MNSQLINPQDLGNGLQLRQATAQDIEALVEFNGRMQYPTYGISVRDLLTQPNPLVGIEDFVLVVDQAANNKIASGAALFTYQWQYAGIPFTVGDVEAVGTDPAYQRRGLSRAVIHAIHNLSAAKGQLAQMISGKAWYYRQFGYEYALAGNGDLHYRVDDTPALPVGEQEIYSIRPAIISDIPILSMLHHQQCKGKLITRGRDEATWHYHINDTSVGSLAVRFNSILNREQQIVGYYSTWGDEPYGPYIILELVVVEGMALHKVLPMLLRHLKTRLARELDRFGESPLTRFTFSIGSAHPVSTLLRPLLSQETPYTYYVRVADLPTFLQHIAPVLAERLQMSVMAGFHGSLYLSFYRNGLQLEFVEGQLVYVKHPDLPETVSPNTVSAEFPPLVFLQLLFGYRSLEELRYAFPDCWANSESTRLLNALFPKQGSLFVY